MSTHTVKAGFGGSVDVESFPGGRFGLTVQNELEETAFVGLDANQANELSIVLAGQKSSLDYEEAVDILFQRLALAASKAGDPNLASVLASLGVGFAIDQSPATQEVVKALVGVA